MDATLTMKRSFWFLEAARGGRQFWVAPLPVLVIWALLHFMTPREGFETVRLSEPLVPNSGKPNYAAWIVAAHPFSLIAIMAGIKLYPEYERLGTIVLCAAAVISPAACFFWAYRTDRDLRRFREQHR